MRSLRSFGAAAACWVIIGLCVLAAGVQIAQVARRSIRWVRQREPVPAFGQADVVYFFEPTCPACRVASPIVEKLRHRYPRYRIARVDTTASAGIALQEEYNRAYQVRAAADGLLLADVAQPLTGIAGASRAEMEKRIKAALAALEGSGQKRMIALLELAEINLPNL